MLTCADDYFVLHFDRDAVAVVLANGTLNPEEGVDGSFELEITTSDEVRTS